jgi:hypothetical protein
MSYFTATGTTLVARRGYGTTPTGLDGVLDTIGNFVKTGVSSAVDIFKSGQQAQGQAQAYANIAAQQAAAQGNRVPGWVIPVVVGGGALAVGALILSSRGRRKNPARRRRRSRRRR